MACGKPGCCGGKGAKETKEETKSAPAPKK
jgi:hypothetical protein